MNGDRLRVLVLNPPDESRRAQVALELIAE